MKDPKHLLASISIFTTALITFTGGVAAPSFSQESPVPPGTPLPPYAKRISIDRPIPYVVTNDVPTAPSLPRIMLTGYWPPTNEMIRHFSPDPVQNPGGWMGGNWEGRGYDIYSFFPEFPSGTLGQGQGDFEVDYQDTSNDFWLIADQIKPVAIITFGLALPNYHWELEWRKRNLGQSSWQSDYTIPLKPTPSPPDGSVSTGFIRYSSLPMERIVAAVNQSGLGINAIADTWGNAGAFLCEYIGYHATWYHDLHALPTDPDPILAGGHIHVGSLIGLPEAIAATEVTLRELISSLEEPLVPFSRVVPATGGRIPFVLNGGLANAGRNYVMAGSVSGTAPGIPLPGGGLLQLNWDSFTDLTLQMANTPYFENFQSALDSSGAATAYFDTQGPIPSGWLGNPFWFGYVVPFPAGQPWFGSNTVKLTIVP